MDRQATQAEQIKIDQAISILATVNLHMTGLTDGRGAVIPSKGF